MDWELIGHEWAVDILTRHLATDQVRHAYLFTGPDGIGKTTLALRYAQALNCEEPPSPGEFCGECRSCRLTIERMHPDLHLLESEEKGLALKVESIRDLQRKLALAPYEGRWRIAVLLRFHEATINAANAMLKTLEEPPDRVVIILTSREAEALPPTVVSRCEVLPLRAVPKSDLEVSLIQRGIDQGDARLLSSVAAGRPGVAIGLSVDDDRLQQRDDDLNDLIEIISMNRAARIEFAEKMTSGKNWQAQKSRAVDLLELWLNFWRDVMLISVRSDVQIGNPDRADVVKTMAEQFSSSKIITIIGSMQSGIDAINQNANVRLTMESVLLEIPSLH